MEAKLARPTGHNVFVITLPSSLWCIAQDCTALHMERDVTVIAYPPREGPVAAI